MLKHTPTCILHMALLTRVGIKVQVHTVGIQILKNQVFVEECSPHLSETRKLSRSFTGFQDPQKLPRNAFQVFHGKLEILKTIKQSRDKHEAKQLNTHFVFTDLQFECLRLS